MSKFSLIKTTKYRLDGESESWMLSIAQHDCVEVDVECLYQLRNTIEKALGIPPDTLVRVNERCFYIPQP